MIRPLYLLSATYEYLYAVLIFVLLISNYFNCCLTPVHSFSIKNDIKTSSTRNMATLDNYSSRHNNINHTLYKISDDDEDDVKIKEGDFERYDVAESVPDFMKVLYEQYQSELHNFTMEIEGNHRYLGAIDLIQSCRLLDIQTFKIPFLYKLIFKSSDSSKTSSDSNSNNLNLQLISKVLRLHRNIFPEPLRTFTITSSTSSSSSSSSPSYSSFYTVMRIYNTSMSLKRQLVITEDSFDKYGWTSIDLKDSKNVILLLKIDNIWQRINNEFRQISKQKFNYDFQKIQLRKFTKQPYHANLINIYKKLSNQLNIDSNEFEKHLYRQLSKSFISRKKRSINKPSDQQQNKKNINVHHAKLCRRHRLKVNFHEVGWNRWIIAPQSYDAYYCDGKCPYPLSDHFKPTNHAIIQLLVHGVKDSTIPRPCCVPFELKPHLLLYLNSDGDALLQQFNNMSVETCSCQ